MIRPILVRGIPVLREKAKRVTQFDKALHRLLDDMVETMQAAPGVGLAGPQVGVGLRVAVLDVDESITVIVNPEIVKRSGEHEPDEGCLSFPGYWGHLRRAEKVTVKARDRHGKELRINADGLLAQALQHEIDHLDGIMYIDRMMEQMGDEWTKALSRSEPPRRREVEEEEARAEERRLDKAQGAAAE